MTRRSAFLNAQRGYRWGLLTAVAVALASTLLAAATTGESILEPIAQVVMQLTPVSVANVLLQRLGLAARPLALMGALAILMALLGLAGAAAGLALFAIRRPASATCPLPAGEGNTGTEGRRPGEVGGAAGHRRQEQAITPLEMEAQTR